MIRELIGKDREKDEEAYVYDEDGIRNEISVIKEDFTDSWKKNIYQKAEKIDFSFWYGEEGLMKKMLLEEKDENSDIMKFPVISEEELTNTINNMRNGKAAGVDGIKSELMKYRLK